MATPKYSAKDATVDDSDNSTPNRSNGDVAVSSGSKPGVDQIRKSDDKADAPKADAAEPDDSTPDDSKADDSKATASKPNAPKDGGTEADGVKRASPKVMQTPGDTGTIQDALTKFKSNIEHGLTLEEAAARLKKDGPNAIEEQHISPLKRFLTFLWGPIPWMIEIAAVLSAVVKHWEDFVIIFFMLALNAVGRLLGRVQGRQRDRSTEKESRTAFSGAARREVERRRSKDPGDRRYRDGQTG